MKLKPPRFLDLRFLGREAKERLRAGHPPEREAGGVMEVCGCGCPTLYDRDSRKWICHACIDALIGRGRPALPGR